MTQVYPCDIFRNQLAFKYPAYGHALWVPGPVEIGDVGFLRDGRFNRLFNALLPADDPSQGPFGVPRDYEQLTFPRCPGHSTPVAAVIVPTETLGFAPYYSNGVKDTSMPASAEPDFSARGPANDRDWGLRRLPQEQQDTLRFSFSCTEKEGGAVLYLPVQAPGQTALARGRFGQHMIKHIKSWFAFTQWHGLGVEQMDEIILVTGYHRTKTSANFAFLEHQEDAQVSFRATEVNAYEATSGIRWRFYLERIQGAAWNYGPQGNLTVC
ncbi:hypothetical protein BJV78DRAFT_1284407 [Lactifluus subvellereus]|nr:hypothetical protein BJV78DRAFT_1284407 [Lactifluus subvellereus]